MQYYMIEWDHEEVDEPWRVYLELDDRGSLRRKIDSYRMGMYETEESRDAAPMDPRELAGDSGNVTVLNRIQFEDMWDQAHMAPDTFMGLFY